MELIFIFTMIFVKILLVHFLQVVKIEWALRIYTLVDDKVFTIFFMDEGMATVRTAKVQGRETVAFFLRESGIADFA